MPDDQPKPVPTEMEHAIATAEFFLDVLGALEVKHASGVSGGTDNARLIEAAKLAVMNTMRHHHYVLEAAAKGTNGAGADAATERQIETINKAISQRRLFLEKTDYAALKGGTLTKAKASEIIDELFNKKG